jgi:D-aspartate ligase
MWLADTTLPVVVLNAYTHCGVTLIRSLGRLGVPVYAVHCTRKAPSLRSRYCRGIREISISDLDPEVAVESLLRVAAEIGGRPLLIPTEDVSCVFVDDHADALQEGYRFPQRPPGLARTLQSKRGMYEVCQRFDVPTPQARFPASRAEIDQFVQSATFPIMVKAVDNRDVLGLPGAGKAIVSSGAELLQMFGRMSTNGSQPKVVLQEYIPGQAESVWMFNGYFDERSECLFWITGRKLRQYPAYVGQTSLGICEANEVVAETTCRLMRALGYTGIVDIGYRYDARDGQYKLLDVNPRIGSAFRLFTDANDLDVARVLYLHMTGQPVPAASPAWGRKWIVENYDAVSSLRYRWDRRLTVRDWAASLRDVDESAWFALDDPRPFLAMGIASAGYALRRSRHLNGNGSSPAPDGVREESR